jgi:hypothetical protein
MSGKEMKKAQREQAENPHSKVNQRVLFLPPFFFQEIYICVQTLRTTERAAVFVGYCLLRLGHGEMASRYRRHTSTIVTLQHSYLIDLAQLPL